MRPHPGDPPRDATTTDGATRNFVRFQRTGDPEALTDVFDEVAPKLLSLACHLSVDPSAAEDLVQDSFLVAIRKARRFDGDRSVVPWLIGILVRETQRYRRRATRSVESLRPAHFDLPDGSTGPGSASIDADLRAQVEGALESLPERYREVVRAAALDGDEPREIARRTGRAPGTVRVQLHRGLDLLRRALPVGLGADAVAGVAPRGLAQIREVVRSEAILRGPALAKTSSSTTFATAAGAFFVGTKTLIAIAAGGAVLVLGIFLSRGDGPGEPDPRRNDATQASELAGPVESLDPAIEPAREASRPASREALEVVDEGPTAADAPGIERSAESPELCVVSGRVVPLSNGQLLEPWVGFLEKGKDAPDTSWPVPLAEFERGGAFTISLPQGARGRFLYADVTGRIGELEWTVPNSASAELEDLLLLVGSEISGTAWTRGETARAGTLVFAQADYELTPAGLVVLRVQRSNGKHVYGSAMGVVDDGGRFEIEGLEPGVTYRLVTVRRPDPSELRTVLISQAAGVLATAPQSGVRLDGDLIGIKVAVTSSGEALSGATVVQVLPADDPRNMLPGGLARSLMARGSGVAFADENGEISFDLVRGAPIGVEVAALGFEPVEIELDPDGLADGEVVPVELKRDAALASIEIELTGVGPGTLSGFQGMIFGHDRKFRQMRLGPVPVVDRRALFEEVTTELRGGRFFLAPPAIDQVVELPFEKVPPRQLDLGSLDPGETRRIQIEVERGGRIEINLTGRKPALPPQFEIVEASGNVVRPPMYVVDGGGFEQVVVIHTDGPIYAGMSLPPGEYTLRQSGPHYEGGSRSVRIDAGQSTPVAFHLIPH